MQISVQSLPEELLIKVFALYLDVEDNHKTRGRTLLALVCAWWRDVVYGNPGFWTEIHSLNTKAQNSLALSKSASSPLQIRFDMTTLSTSRWRRMQTSFAEACEHMERWQAVTITVGRQDGISQYLNAPAPALEYLDLSTDTIGLLGSTLLVNPFQGQAARLTFVKLIHAALPWTMLSGLEHLELRGLYNHYPTIAEITFMLIASPKLHTLMLIGPGTEPDPSYRPPTIPLGHLRKIRLSGVDPRVICYLFQYIQSPPCRSLNLTIDLNATNSISFFASLAPFIPDTTNEVIHIELLDGAVDWSISSACYLHFAGLPVPEVLGYLATTLRPDVLVTQVQVHAQEVDALAISALEPFRVIKLTVGACSNDRDLITWLSNPSDKWALPELRDLKITASSFGIRRMVEARYGKGAGVSSSDLPLPFSSLVVSIPSEENMDEDQVAVERIVGPNKVVWKIVHEEEDMFNLGEEESEEGQEGQDD